MSEQWRKCDVDGRAFNGVREKRDRGERGLERALSALASALDGLGTPWMVIGGIAVIARGVRRMTTDGVLAPMATPENLVIFKAMASRPKDVEDATALLIMHRDIGLARVRRRLRELSLLAEEPSLSQGLETIIALARQATSPPKRANEAPSTRIRGDGAPEKT